MPVCYPCCVCATCGSIAAATGLCVLFSRGLCKPSVLCLLLFCFAPCFAAAVQLPPSRAADAAVIGNEARGATHKVLPLSDFEPVPAIRSRTLPTPCRASVWGVPKRPVLSPGPELTSGAAAVNRAEQTLLTLLEESARSSEKPFFHA